MRLWLLRLLHLLHLRHLFNAPPSSPTICRSGGNNSSSSSSSSSSNSSIVSNSVSINTIHAEPGGQSAEAAAETNTYGLVIGKLQIMLMERDDSETWIVSPVEFFSPAARIGYLSEKNYG